MKNTDYTDDPPQTSYAVPKPDARLKAEGGPHSVMYYECIMNTIRKKMVYLPCLTRVA